VTGIRRCRDEDFPAILEIVNSAAEKYRGAIPADCWHEPYMPAADLAEAIASGVQFWGVEMDGALAGVMGVQRVLDVHLIRHAYVRPDLQGRGVGGLLLNHLTSDRRSGKLLVGTWAAAGWAIGFYERHGFSRVDLAEVPRLLRTYWTISDRQIETSVVLTKSQ
jgi:N-acetylglutamate synthase-like GNAT family acetyltransferase